MSMDEFEKALGRVSQTQAALTLGAMPGSGQTYNQLYEAARAAREAVSALHREALADANRLALIAGRVGMAIDQFRSQFDKELAVEARKGDER